MQNNNQLNDLLASVVLGLKEEVKIRNSNQVLSDCNPLLNSFTPHSFFESLHFPDEFSYSNYFKLRLFEMHCLGLVRAESLALDLRREVSNINGACRINRPRTSKLHCLKGYDIHHHHVEGYINEYLHQLFTKVKGYKGDVTIDNASAVVEEIQQSILTRKTGHWVIYTNQNGKRLYLDVVQHHSKEFDADCYLKNVGLKVYRDEFPNLFL
ncbi:hypothetical protein MW362_002744 [Vibrio parahaemolyticus]|uniref:hypothetical protein n=1 Tax=Vibrio parahaemolyticus TaxID=670 RepID=UPI000BE4907D|nr:hypothetical protein [Vibrio parahaemolyticus]ATI47247.1 hypothetical protein CO725_17135 [Vibrio parahaemolyticus]EJB8585009.1 hypothetical protein [Vibrio parahaemolyticus]MBE5181204.1 hypothetical protein [Vibrio parahaemolyticus]